MTCEQINVMLLAGLFGAIFIGPIATLAIRTALTKKK